MIRTNFQNLRVYQLAEQLADEIWDIIKCWDHFTKDTIGKQLARSADSIGANIAEGEGRGSYQDNRRFVKIARGFYRKLSTGSEELLSVAFYPKIR
jgi:four helix bundle protein